MQLKLGTALRILVFVGVWLIGALSAGCGGPNGPLARAENGALALVPAQAQADSTARAQVDPQVKAELAAELERVLRLYPPRTASAPPASSASATMLSWNEEARAFQWRYYSVGDYDQNGEVGVSDLTPLGVNFGKSSGGGPFNPSTVESVIDGDSNGEIGVTDVTPIGQNFGVRSQGYRLYFSADEGDVPQSAGESNGAGTQRVAELPLSEATGTPAERKLFSHTPAEALPAGYYWVRPYDELKLGTPSNAVQAVPPTPQAPTAALEASPTTGPAALAVVYDASGSSDSDGEIVGYEWDFDQSGNFAYDSGAEPTTTFYYYEPGTYRTSVRVTDDDGMAAVSATVEVMVELGAEWHDVTVPAADITDSSKCTALADVAGTPAIAYMTHKEDPHRYWINYIRASDSKGADWTDPVTIQETDYDLTYLSIVIAEGRPAIVGHEEYEDDVTYVRAEDSTGTSWPEPAPCQSFYGIQGDDVTLALIGGLPALCRDDKFARALDLAGEDWPLPVEYATGSFEAKYASPALCEVAYRPAVSFYANGRLAYVRADDAEGQDWGIAAIVDDQDAAAGSSRLLVVGGHPAIAYYYPTLGTLKYVRALDPEGTAWASPLTLVAAREAPYGLILVDGRPAILYTEYGSFPRLQCLIANDAGGQSWGFPLQVADWNGSEERTDFAPIAGGLAVSNYVSIAEDVRALAYAAYY